jgi:regulator of sigma E protease
MLTLPAFIVAIALLITVHEFGHYRVALACGVKVLRFSIGFGWPLYRWAGAKTGTEFVVALVPLGGYVRMLDEREAPVSPEQRHLAFNTQQLRHRVAIVAAGPLANLALAVFLYASVNWIGVELPAPVLSHPDPQTLAAKAGVSGGEVVIRAAVVGHEANAVQSFDELRWVITQGALEGKDVVLMVSTASSTVQERVIELSTLSNAEVNEKLFEKIGILGPLSRPVIGQILADSAAQQAGLQVGDEVLEVNDQHMFDAAQLRQSIRQSNIAAVQIPQNWRVSRGREILLLQVKPNVVSETGQTIGRIGAYIGAPAQVVTVRFGLLDGFWHAAEKTWGVSVLTLKMMGKLLIGEASLKNISGPLTIADYAGKSASLGLTQYLTFLALISVSLGVLNLLPLPILDGGHLMYYLWEGVTGKPVSEAWLEKLQRGGMAVLMLMMFIALFNDLSRLIAS